MKEVTNEKKYDKWIGILSISVICIVAIVFVVVVSGMNIAKGTFGAESNGSSCLDGEVADGKTFSVSGHLYKCVDGEFEYLGYLDSSQCVTEASDYCAGTPACSSGSYNGITYYNYDCEPRLDGNPSSGSSSNTCDPGRFLAPNGICSQCSTGYACPDGVEAVSCNPGHYQDEVEQVSCKECPIGYYQDGIGMSECKKCPDGTTTYGKGKTSQSDCVDPDQVDSVTISFNVSGSVTTLTCTPDDVSSTCHVDVNRIPVCSEWCSDSEQTQCDWSISEVAGPYNAGHTQMWYCKTSASPSTASPSTASPSTASPSTASPGTANPSTASPSTASPSTASPSTASPSTASPSTASPSTASPSTASPSTASPGTASPSTGGGGGGGTSTVSSCYIVNHMYVWSTSNSNGGTLVTDITDANNCRGCETGYVANGDKCEAPIPSAVSLCYLKDHKYHWVTSKPNGAKLITNITDKDKCQGCETGYIANGEVCEAATGSAVPPVNPQTGTAAIIFVWLVGLCAIGYSFWYFKRVGTNK